MRIAIGSDHAGFHLKEHVKGELQSAGHDVTDVGTASAESVDYPAFAGRAARLAGGRDEGGAGPARGPRGWGPAGTWSARCWPAAGSSAWRSSRPRSAASARSTRTTRLRPRWRAGTT